MKNIKFSKCLRGSFCVRNRSDSYGFGENQELSSPESVELGQSRVVAETISRAIEPVALIYICIYVFMYVIICFQHMFYEKNRY